MNSREKIIQIVDSLGVQYREYNSKLIGPCPVHGGDNPNAFNINVDEYSEYFGNWFCNTHGCHMSGFTFYDLVIKLTGKSYDEVKKMIELSSVDRDPTVAFFSRKSKIQEQGLSREKVRAKLIIPPDFYLQRGFSKEILDEFDVGLCTKNHTQMYNRVVFPIYHNNKMVGCTGRTVLDNKEIPKWTISKGFNKSSFLYGLWKSEEHIRRTKTIILVEGQGDVLKLHQSGIRNAVGIFGSALSEAQEFLIQKSGALNIIIWMDDDDAGRKARNDIERKTSRLFNIKHIVTPQDAGDMNITDIRNIESFKGYI